MEKNKIGKLDRYAETRLWNLKLKDKNISTKDLLKELFGRYNLSENDLKREELKLIIRRARRRVYKRQNEIKKNIKQWAPMLGLEKQYIADLVLQGKLTKDNIDIVVLIVNIKKSY